jgi:hypothetical protein
MTARKSRAHQRETREWPLRSDLRTFCGKSDCRTGILHPALVTRILQPGEQSFVVSVVWLEPYSFHSTKHHDFAGRGACLLHDLDNAAGMVFGGRFPSRVNFPFASQRRNTGKQKFNKCLIFMVSAEGLEPSTPWLKDECQLADLDAFLGVNAQLNRRMGDDVGFSTPFENRFHCILRRAIPSVLRAC